MNPERGSIGVIVLRVLPCVYGAVWPLSHCSDSCPRDAGGDSSCLHIKKRSSGNECSSDWISDVRTVKRSGQ